MYTHTLKMFYMNFVMLRFIAFRFQTSTTMNSMFSYEKVVVKEGYGKSKPNEFSECHILLCVQQPEQQASSDAVSSIGYELNREIKVVIGHGTTHVACTVDLCVLTMFEGEQCRLQTKCSSAVSAAADTEFLTLEVTLLSLFAANDLHTTSHQEKLMRAITLKDIGTSAFVAGNISAAFHKFSRSLKYLICAAVDNDKSCTGDNSLSNGTSSDDSSHPVLLANGGALDQNMCNLTCEDIAQLTCHCWLNLAACQLRYQNFKMAAANCSKALEIDPNNVKGLFRRAQCNMNTGCEHIAVTDLKRALTLEPGNREVMRLLNAAQRLSRESDDKLASAMSKMFQ